MNTSIRRYAARWAAAMLAFACALCLCLPALAAEGVTRSIGGVNFTVPADWEEASLVEGVEVDGLSELDVYAKEDGALIVGLLPDADLGGTTLDELQMIADLAPSMIEEEVPFLSASFSAQEEQGRPCLTVSTDDIFFNGVQYALTAKLFVVDGTDFCGGVVMVSFLPASGQVTEGFADTLLVSHDEAFDVTVGGIAYTVPAGSASFEGSIFGIDFFCAVADDGVAAMVNVPYVVDGEVVTVADMQELADEMTPEALMEGVDATGNTTLELLDFWAGAYEFLGFPTLGVEMTMADQSMDEPLYLAITASDTSEGVSVLVALQPDGSPFVENLLGSAVAVASPRLAPQTALPAAAPAADNADPGFSVGL